MKDIDTLLAVVAGGIHRPVGILRSSLYPMLLEEDEVTAQGIATSTIWNYAVVADTVLAGILEVTLFNVRSTLIEVEVEDIVSNSNIHVVDFTVRTTLITYTEEADAVAANTLNVINFNARQILVAYKEEDDATTAEGLTIQNFVRT